MASTFCKKNGLKKKKNSGFCLKVQKFIHFKQYDFVQISPVCGPNTYQIMYGETLDVKCQHYFVTEAQKSFNDKFTAKMFFRSGILCYHY